MNMVQRPLATGFVIAAVLACVGPLTAAGETLRIADVQVLPRAGLAGKSVVITGGVVTWIRLPDRSRLTIQDGDRGMWITTHTPWPKSPDVWRGSAYMLNALAVGDEVEIEGLLDPGGFAPKLMARDLRVVGRRSVPEPIAVEDEPFFSGADECCRIAVTGVVQGFGRESNHWLLHLARAGRRFEARVPSAVCTDPATDLVDGTVMLVGTTIAAFNARGELLYPRVMVMDGSDVSVVTPPPAPPFSARAVPLAEIATFRPDPIGPHRLRTEGTVNYVFNGGFYLQDGPTGIRVETVDDASVSPDDRVEVAGFLDRRGHATGLQNAVVRVVGRGTAHPPLAVSPADVVRSFTDARLAGTAANPGDYDGCLVTFSARLADKEPTPSGGRFLLAADGLEANVVARMDAATFASLAAIRPGSRLQVTGLLQIEALTPSVVWSELGIDHLTLGIRSPADVAVLKAPSWWTPQRLTAALAALAALAAGTLAWVLLLRRQVNAQAARILHELQSRRNAAVEFQATLRERNRLAASLHDTILQTLAGVLLQLDVCRRSLLGQKTDDTSDQLDVAKKMVRHAATDLRSSVWALRMQPMAGRSFGDSLAAVVQYLQGGEGPRIALAREGAPFELPKFVAGNLLLVIQEAVRNACNHAGATRVDVVVAYDAAARIVTATIRDDGAGFDPAGAVGPDQGHFGIQGMRERIAGLGGELSLSSQPGHGTTVAVRVGVLAHDSELDAEGQRELVGTG